MFGVIEPHTYVRVTLSAGMLALLVLTCSGAAAGAEIGYG